MANLTFPSNPTNGQKYTFNGKVFEYSSSTGRWSATRAQLLGSLPDDVTIDAPTLSVSLNTLELDESGANVIVTYTVDQDVDASLSVTGIEDTTTTLYKSNNTIVVTAGETEFANGQINLVVSNGRRNDTETISVSTAYAWAVDLTQVTYDNVSYIITRESVPTGLSFSNDGTRMFVCGVSSGIILQYTLGTAFDLSTASYELFAHQSDTLSEITFNNDGTKMFVCRKAPNPDSVLQYTLGTAFDISTASYDDVSFSVSGQQISLNGLTFSNDGTKMFICGSSPDSVQQYTLGTAFDVSTASYDDVSFGVNVPQGLSFNDDGTKLYVINPDSVYQYTLGSAFDLSTVSYDDVSFSVSGQDSSTQSINFSNDGTKMYVVGASGDKIYQYSTGL